MTGLLITIGPATESEAMLEQLLDLGVSQFRFAASKLSFDGLCAQAERVRELARRRGEQVQTWLDLPGSKPRLDSGSTGVVLATGAAMCVAFGQGQSQAGVRVLGMPLKDAGLVSGDILLIGDGEQALEVRAVRENELDAVVLVGGKLGKTKGLTVAGKTLAHSSLSEQDADMLRQLSNSPFSGAIISFCGTRADVDSARNALADAPLPIMAKIETVHGVRNAYEIASVADAVLVGRGDLLLDAGPVEFHSCCKQVLFQAGKAQAPVYVGTQLMPSLSTMWLPHRSELSCLSQLIEDGVDGLMLANETSTGGAPIRTVALLKELIKRYGRLPATPLLRRGVTGNTVF